MDVTPTKSMLEFMQKFTDAMCGEAPLKTERSPGAQKRKQARAMCMQMLHDVVRLSMREGVGRYLNEMGKPTIKDQIRRNPLAAAISQMDHSH